MTETSLRYGCSGVSDVPRVMLVPLAVASKQVVVVPFAVRLRLWPLGVKKMSRLPDGVAEAACELLCRRKGPSNAAPAPRPRSRLRREKRARDRLDEFWLIGGTFCTRWAPQQMKRGAHEP